MADSVTRTETTVNTVKEIVWDWLSDCSGNVSDATTYSYDGLIEAAVFVPDTSGTQPSDNYDVTILDRNSIDVLHGLGADCSQSATVYKQRVDGLGAVAGSTLTLTIANAGDEKGGVVYLYLR